MAIDQRFFLGDMNLAKHFMRMYWDVTGYHGCTDHI